MTAQRRTRRHSPGPGQQDRLRALTLDASPVARRLRARIPRPPSEPPPPPRGAPPIPSAPYAVAGTRTPYRAQAPDAGPPPPGARPGRRSEGPADAAAPPRPSPAGASSARTPPVEAAAAAPGAVAEADRTRRAAESSRRAAGRGEGRRERAAEPVRDTGARGADGAGAFGPGTWPGSDGGRHRRSEGPPSGYAEFDPEPPGSLLERLARRWPPRAALSRRAVVALAVLGALAVVLVLALYHRPTAVPAPELVTRAAPVPAAVEDGAQAPADDTGTGAGEAGAGEAGAGEAGAGAPEEDLVVHVGGEVSDPGLYTLPPGSRVADAVEEAGGALPDADLDLLNLARPLVDGEQVLVGVPAPAGTGGAGTGPRGAGGLVDINRADRALLETLPGVGTVIADNIVTYREEHGPFRSVGDLVNVDRIGEKVLADLEPHVTVG